ncbi:hypothetical protein OESDEN_01760 [Oesophagostomum dentatum]|uniref:Phospholipid/glycerol acyltransferase domain-containing protein n=1 Tax=Oesophagostomum dentatum TaxID=61180 RepID=A0A0B1TS86_OESDE|nr:hypothetical protein OESDEN_01760 [Oesophagostomum dentatum]
MCAVLGIIVRSEGKSRRRISNIRCFGYVDLGARVGRSELVRRARIHVENEALPLLAFPEGAITNGHTGLLKFSPWPCEVSDQIQPLVLRISRPLFNVSPAVLGSSWISDVLWFIFLPFSIYDLKWLPVLQRNDQIIPFDGLSTQETPEDFAHRLECLIAEHLGIRPTNFTHGDASEAAKRHLHSRTAPIPVKRMVDSRVLDEVAMRIKQSYPSSALFDIRMDLERSRDQQSSLNWAVPLQTTIDRIKSGNLGVFPRIMGKVPSDPSQWKRLFTERKWTLIETNRQRYLARLNKLIGAGDQ